MRSVAYFELFGRIADEYVTEAIIPAVVPTLLPKKGFKQTTIGRLLSKPAFIAAVGAAAAVAVALAVGFGIAGWGGGSDTDTRPPAGEILWESGDTEQDSTKQENTETDAETEAIDGDHPYIERKSYDGSVCLFYVEDMVGKGFAYLPEDMVFAGASKLNADLFERVQEVEEYLGVDIGAVPIAADNLSRTVSSMMRAGEDEPVIVVASAYSVIDLSNRYLTPWDAMSSVNTDGDYWDTELFQIRTEYGGNYLAYSDFIPPNAYAVAYNKSLYATSAIQRDLYALVESGNWTLDTMASVLNETAVGKHGLAIHDTGSVCAYLSAVGFTVISNEKTADGYVWNMDFAAGEDARIPLYDRVYAFLTGERVDDWWYDEDNPFLENGEALMDTRLTRELAAKAYGTSMGVLPLPKYDTAQKEYVSFHVNAYMGCVTNEINRQMCSDTAEMLAYVSRNTRTDYERAVMGVYGKEDDSVLRDLEMLAIIHDTSHDFGIMSNGVDSELTMPILERTERYSSTRIVRAIQALKRLLTL